MLTIIRNIHEDKKILLKILNKEFRVLMFIIIVPTPIEGESPVVANFRKANFVGRKFS